MANTGDPENYLRENWYSTSANNTAGYANKDVDAWLDELSETIDEDARKELIVKIQQAIMMMLQLYSLDMKILSLSQNLQLRAL